MALKCDICGRHPSKEMNFKAHQGFLIMRRELRYEGRFCRDCAIEILGEVNKKNLKGMWFSPSSLVFGSARAIMNIGKMADLPSEVLDEPWVPFKVKCEKCRAKFFSPVGQINCPDCGQVINILSCPSCDTFHTDYSGEKADECNITCRNCNKQSKGTPLVRNWPLFLISKIMAEIAVKIALADGKMSIQEWNMYKNTIEELFDFTDSTKEVLYNYFFECEKGDSAKILNIGLKELNTNLRITLLQFAISIADADFIIDPKEVREIKKFLKRFKIDPEIFFPSQDKKESFQDLNFQEILSIKIPFTIDELKTSYRRLVKQCHPDLFTVQREKVDATSKLKEINVAYSAALEYLRSL